MVKTMQRVSAGIKAAWSWVERGVQILCERNQPFTNAHVVLLLVDVQRGVEIKDLFAFRILVPLNMPVKPVVRESRKRGGTGA